MNTPTPKLNRTVIAVLVLLCAALGGWVAQTHSQLGELQAQQAELQKKLEAETKQAGAAVAEVAKLHQQTEGAAAQSVSLPGEADKSAHKRNFTTEELAALSKSPALQNIIASQQDAIIKLTYGAMLDRFKLTPEERDYLEKLLIEKQMVQVTNGMQMMNPGLAPDERAALGQQIEQGVKDDDAKIRAFLNDDGDFSYYQTYAQQEPEQMEVGMLQTSLGEDELDPDKAEALANLMNDARNNYPFTVNFYDHRNFGNPAVLNPGAVNQFLDEQTQFQAQEADKAAPMLTPAQLDAFKQNQAAIRQMTKMQLNSILQLTGSGQ